MTKPQAHRILDTAKAGAPISGRLITRALIVTGDLARRLGPKREVTA